MQKKNKGQGGGVRFKCNVEIEGEDEVQPMHNVHEESILPGNVSFGSFKKKSLNGSFNRSSGSDKLIKEKKEPVRDPFHGKNASVFSRTPDYYLTYPEVTSSYRFKQICNFFVLKK